MALADVFLVASNSCDLCLEIKKLHLVAFVTLDGGYREVPETILWKHCPAARTWMQKCTADSDVGLT